MILLPGLILVKIYQRLKHSFSCEGDPVDGVDEEDIVDWISLCGLSRVGAG